jgi:hypothetical protein
LTATPKVWTRMQDSPHILISKNIKKDLKRGN